MSFKFEDPNGQKQLLTSIFCNNVHDIKSLLKKNQSLLTYKYGDPFNKTVLEIACCEFITVVQDETVKFLIQNGAQGYRALYFAARARNLEIMEEILDNKSLRDNLVIIYLINYMKSYNKHEEDYMDVLQLLLIYIDINTQDNSGCTAIYLAAKYGYAKMVNVILNICKDTVDLDSFSDKKLITARDMIKMNIELTENLSAPKYVFDNKINLKTLLTYIRQKRENDFLVAYKEFYPEDLDKDNRILLLAAAERGLVNIVRYFLYIGVDSNKMFKYYAELFPLKFASLRGHYEVVEVLLKFANSNTINNCIMELVRTKFEVMESVKINHKRCYELLLENEKLDINFKDENKNTVLHYAAKHQSSEIILMTLRRGASLASRNGTGKMTVELIDEKTLEQHLDECVIVSKFHNVPNRNTIDFNFTSLLPGTILDERDLTTQEEEKDSEYFFETNVLQYISSKRELHHLLQHPVIDVFLFTKWESVKKFVLINLVIYTLFIISLSAYVSWKHICNTSEYIIGIYVLLKVIVTLFLLVLIGRELIQIFIFRFQYFKSYENWIELTLIGSTITLLFTNCQNRVLLNQVCAVAVVSAAIELMLLSGRQFKILFISSMMLRTVSMTLFKWFMSYAILILAFSCAFFFIFSHGPNQYFLNPYVSLFKTFVMVTGEFDLSDLDFNEHYVIGPIIFIVFVFLINIVLLGVCTALAISDIQMIINDAETQTQIVKIEHIVYWEKVLNSSKILSFEHWFQGYLQLKFIQKEPIIKLNIVNDIKVDVYKITSLYKNKMNLEKKTIKNIIAKTEKSTKYNIKEYPTVDETFFFNLRTTF